MGNKENSAEPSATDRDELARQIMKEANYYALASNFFWALWAINMATSTTISFGYMVGARDYPREHESSLEISLGICPSSSDRVLFDPWFDHRSWWTNSSSTDGRDSPIGTKSVSANVHRRHEKTNELIDLSLYMFLLLFNVLERHCFPHFYQSINTHTHHWTVILFHFVRLTCRWESYLPRSTSLKSVRDRDNVGYAALWPWT